MTRLVARKLLSSLLLVWLLLTVLFFLLHLAPGDPLQTGSPNAGSFQAREQLASHFGLDRPLGEQYLSWLSAIVLRGDWGTSFVHRRPVTQVLADALPNTVLLAVTALLIDLLLGVTLGILAARYHETPLDHAIRTFSLLFYSVPSFWFGLMAILLFSTALPLFPPSHMISPALGEVSGLRHALDVTWHLVLPASVIGLTRCGGTVRLVRTSLLEVLHQDYIRTARAKGLSESRVLWVHALPNAAAPLIHFVGLTFPRLLNGSLVIEVVFSWPGVGRVFFSAIYASDYPVVLAATALSGVLVIAGNFLADLAHGWVDPTLRLGDRAHA